jgi:ubiquitin C-terminal hydrolase
MPHAKQSDALFQLVGVLVHWGSNIRGSHHTAFVKSSSDDFWTECNDKICTAVPWETVRKQEAYVLFYSKVLEGVLLEREAAG